MAENRRKAMAGLAALVASSLFICMLTGGASARAPGEQVDFTGHVSTLGLTQTAQTPALRTPAGPSGPQPTMGPPVGTPPVMVPIEDDQYAPCGTLQINGQSYPIGDRFTDASGIILGTTVNADVWGGNGYAVIQDSPDYRLLWITRDDGTRQYVIVHMNDPLFTDENTGFAHYTEIVSDGFQTLFTVGASALTAAGTLIVAGFTVCAPSVGIGSGIAAGGAFVAGAVSSIGEWWIRGTIIDPGLRNLELQLQTIDINTGEPHPCEPL